VERAIEFTVETLRSTMDPELRGVLQVRLEALRAEQAMRQIEDAARSFKDRNLRFPLGLDELLNSGVISEAPLDIWLDSNGTAHSTKTDRLTIYRNPNEPEFQVDQ